MRREGKERDGRKVEEGKRKKGKEKEGGVPQNSSQIYAFADLDDQLVSFSALTLLIWSSGE